jgi:hypothetical protein
MQSINSLKSDLTEYNGQTIVFYSLLFEKGKTRLLTTNLWWFLFLRCDCVFVFFTGPDEIEKEELDS